MFITAKKLPSLHVNLKRTKFSEVNTPSNRFFELNFLSLLYVIMVKRKVFCHFFGLWVGPSRMRCRHFKSESCARKNFCLLFCSIFFSLVRYLYNASINDQEGEKRMGFFWLHEKPQDYKKCLVISLSYYFLYNWKKNEADLSDFSSALWMVRFVSLFWYVLFVSWGIYMVWFDRLAI